ATILSEYFGEISKRINEALFENAKTTAHFPESEEEFRATLQRYGLDWNSLRDPWGHPYRFETSTKVDYSDKITIRAYGQSTATSSTPVTRSLKTILIWSNGPDGISRNDDDFSLGTFVSPLRDETGGTGASAVPQKTFVYSGGTGAIRVEVKDVMG